MTLMLRQRGSGAVWIGIVLLAAMPVLGIAQSAATTPVSANAPAVRELFASGAFCWFADPRAVRHVDEVSGADKIYVGCIDTDGTVKALQFDTRTGTESVIVLDEGFQPDDHNNPTFLILPDERVMVFWSAHTIEPRFYYRVSQRPHDLREMSERKEVSVDGFGNFTYPSAFYLTSTPNSFYLCWRGIKWHPTVARYSLPDAQGDIRNESRPLQIVQSTAARPYAKYTSNGRDRIRFAYTTGHPDNEFPNWLYYSELDVRTLDLFDVENRRLANVAEAPFPISHASARGALVVDAPENFKNWVWDLAHDEQDRPVIAMVRLTQDARSHEYHVAAWTGSDWRITPIGHGGGWFHQNPRDAEKCYSGGLVLDAGDPRRVYASLPTEGRYGRVYEIWRIELGPDGAVRERVAITRDSTKNNVRPYAIPGTTPADPIHVVWMNGDYYFWIVNEQNPLGFPTRLLTAGAPAATGGGPRAAPREDAALSAPEGN